MELSSTGVVIQHEFLIQKRHIGRWNVFHCLCCSMDTHGVPCVTGLSVLANPTLLVCSHPVSLSSSLDHSSLILFICLQTNPQQIASLQRSDRFSPVFKVVLPSLGNGGPSSPRIFPGRNMATPEVWCPGMCRCTKTSLVSLQRSICKWTQR